MHKIVLLEVMHALKIYFILILLSLQTFAQDSLITVPLNQLGRDERFEKTMVTMPVFILERDTALTMDFEDLRPAKKVHVKKPTGYNAYGYSYVFFTGNNNAINPGYVNLLIAGVYDKNPHLFIDRNNNFDFTDDGEKLELPSQKGDSLLFTLYRKDDTLAGISVKLKRLDFGSQPGYIKLMNDYYAFFYKDRTFSGINYSYREQRYVTKFGVVKIDGDSFKLALHDGNSNGLYNEADADKIMTSNFADSIFDSQDELHTFTVSKKNMYVEYHGEQFEVVEIDAAGTFIKLKQLKKSLLLGKIEPGKKIPKFKFTEWTGSKGKIKKFRRYDVYLYFTGFNVKNFSHDTAILRQIANANPDKLKVIAFIDINKSYELKIFGTYSNLNYIAAYKEKDIVKKLFVRGLPSSVWLTKKRRVVNYNIKPEDFLKAYEEYHNKK